jgi:hypothetical protein
MLFRAEFLEGIRRGAITLAFRRWRRPTVRTGGTLMTAVGQLHIRSVEPVTLAQISTGDARRAGYASKAALLEELARRPEGDVFRIELGALRPDPRIALRETPATTNEELSLLRSRLQRLDAASSDGPWTLATLRVLRDKPGVRAGDLCDIVGQEKMRFKLNVRKLKNLGLTDSLGTGYRLSPRGEAVLGFLVTQPFDSAPSSG